MIARQLHGQLTLLVGQTGVGTAAEEDLDGSFLAVDGGEVQRGVLFVVFDVDIGSLRQQLGYHLL